MRQAAVLSPLAEAMRARLSWPCLSKLCEMSLPHHQQMHRLRRLAFRRATLAYRLVRDLPAIRLPALKDRSYRNGRIPYRAQALAQASSQLRAAAGTRMERKFGVRAP
jgi:hypothetical protein